MDGMRSAQGKLQGTAQRVVSILHFSLSAGLEKMLPKVQLPALQHTGTLSNRAKEVSAASDLGPSAEIPLQNSS